MCDIRSATPTFADLTTINALICDTSGNLMISPGTLFGGEHVGATEGEGYMRTTGGIVRQTTLTSAVTTNTTSTAVEVPIGAKSFYGQVVGTGAVTQTQAIYCDIDSDAANGVLLATLTLSGTTRDQALSSVVTAACSYLYVTTTNTTGTSATGAVYVMY
jgi:hypothetical protein